MGQGWHRASKQFFYGNGNDNHHLGADVCVHKGIISAAKLSKFDSNMMSKIKHQTVCVTLF
jgi:hypothetical protein